jgi:hypothetical protein
VAAAAGFLAFLGLVAWGAAPTGLSGPPFHEQLVIDWDNRIIDPVEVPSIEVAAATLPFTPYVPKDLAMCRRTSELRPGSW